MPSPKTGWIKIHRKMQEWEWYDDSDTKALFLHLLLTANREDGVWHGIKVKRGQVVTGRKMLAEMLGISEQKIRTCIKRLKSTNEITSKSTNKFTIITLINYDTYQKKEKGSNQQINQDSNQQSTSNQPAINQQSTTNKKLKKLKEVEEVEEVEENTPLPPAGGKIILPSWMPSHLWESFIEVRKTKNKKTADKFSALTLILNKLDKWKSEGYDPVDILETSVMSGWSGVFKPKQKQKQYGGQMEQTVDALQRFVERGDGDEQRDIFARFSSS